MGSRHDMNKIEVFVAGITVGLFIAGGSKIVHTACNQPEPAIKTECVNEVGHKVYCATGELIIDQTEKIDEEKEHLNP